MIVSTLLLISAQLFALEHLHIGVDHASLPDCTECAFAKVPLTPIADTPPQLIPPTGQAGLLPLPASAPLTVSSRFQLRAREPPSA
jgi:hypothetical protein